MIPLLLSQLQVRGGSPTTSLPITTSSSEFVATLRSHPSSSEPSSFSRFLAQAESLASKASTHTNLADSLATPQLQEDTLDGKVISIDNLVTVGAATSRSNAVLINDQSADTLVLTPQQTLSANEESVSTGLTLVDMVGEQAPLIPEEAEDLLSVAEQISAGIHQIVHDIVNKAAVGNAVVTSIDVAVSVTEGRYLSDIPKSFLSVRLSSGSVDTHDRALPTGSFASRADVSNIPQDLIASVAANTAETVLEEAIRTVASADLGLVSVKVSLYTDSAEVRDRHVQTSLNLFAPRQRPVNALLIRETPQVEIPALQPSSSVSLVFDQAPAMLSVEDGADNVAAQAPLLFKAVGQISAPEVYAPNHEGAALTAVDLAGVMNQQKVWSVDAPESRMEEVPSATGSASLSEEISLGDGNQSREISIPIIDSDQRDNSDDQLGAVGGAGKFAVKDSITSSIPTLRTVHNIVERAPVVREIIHSPVDPMTASFRSRANLSMLEGEAKVEQRNVNTDYLSESKTAKVSNSESAPDAFSALDITGVISEKDVVDRGSGDVDKATVVEEMPLLSAEEGVENTNRLDGKGSTQISVGIDSDLLAVKQEPAMTELVSSPDSLESIPVANDFDSRDASRFESAKSSPELVGEPSKSRDNFDREPLLSGEIPIAESTIRVVPGDDYAGVATDGILTDRSKVVRDYMTTKQGEVGTTRVDSTTIPEDRDAIGGIVTPSFTSDVDVVQYTDASNTDASSSVLSGAQSELKVSKSAEKNVEADSVLSMVEDKFGDAVQVIHHHKTDSQEPLSAREDRPSITPKVQVLPDSDAPLAATSPKAQRLILDEYASASDSVQQPEQQTSTLPDVPPVSGAERLAKVALSVPDDPEQRSAPVTTEPLDASPYAESDTEGTALIMLPKDSDTIASGSAVRPETLDDAQPLSSLRETDTQPSEDMRRVVTDVDESAPRVAVDERNAIDIMTDTPFPVVIKNDVATWEQQEMGLSAEASPILSGADLLADAPGIMIPEDVDSMAETPPAKISPYADSLPSARPITDTSVVLSDMTGLLGREALSTDLPVEGAPSNSSPLPETIQNSATSKLDSTHIFPPPPSDSTDKQLRQVVPNAIAEEGIELVLPPSEIVSPVPIEDPEAPSVAAVESEEGKRAKPAVLPVDPFVVDAPEEKKVLSEIDLNVQIMTDNADYVYVNGNISNKSVEISSNKQKYLYADTRAIAADITSTDLEYAQVTAPVSALKGGEVGAGNRVVSTDSLRSEPILTSRLTDVESPVDGLVVSAKPILTEPADDGSSPVVDDVVVGVEERVLATAKPVDNSGGIQVWEESKKGTTSTKPVAKVVSTQAVREAGMRAELPTIETVTNTNASTFLKSTEPPTDYILSGTGGPIEPAETNRTVSESAQRQRGEQPEISQVIPSDSEPISAGVVKEEAQVINGVPSDEALPSASARSEKQLEWGMVARESTNDQAPAVEVLERAPIHDMTPVVERVAKVSEKNIVDVTSVREATAESNWSPTFEPSVVESTLVESGERSNVQNNVVQSVEQQSVPVVPKDRAASVEPMSLAGARREVGQPVEMAERTALPLPQDGAEEPILPLSAEPAERVVAARPYAEAPVAFAAAERVLPKESITRDGAERVVGYPSIAEGAPTAEANSPKESTFLTVDSASSGLPLSDDISTTAAIPSSAVVGRGLPKPTLVVAPTARQALAAAVALSEAGVAVEKKAGAVGAERSFAVSGNPVAEVLAEAGVRAVPLADEFTGEDSREPDSRPDDRHTEAASVRLAAEPTGGTEFAAKPVESPVVVMPQPVATAPQTAAPVVRTIHRVPVKNVPVAIAEAVRSSVQRGGGVVVMTLNPDSLGALDIAIRVRGNQARISIRTEMSETKALLEHTMPLLMERLSAAGVKAEPVDVAMRARNAEDVATGPSADRDRGGHSADDHKQHREQMAALRRAAVGGVPRKEYSTFA